jgi:hypothetical protein
VSYTHGQGGGIYVTDEKDTKLKLTATIVANNTADLVRDNNIHSNLEDTRVSGGFNLFNDNPNGFDEPTDLSSKSVCLLPLADNGGPAGQTHTKTREPEACPNSTVWARNNGPATGPTVDQRTFTRPDGPKTDIGAFECQGIECPYQGQGPIGAPTAGNEPRVTAANLAVPSTSPATSATAPATPRLKPRPTVVHVSDNDVSRDLDLPLPEARKAKLSSDNLNDLPWWSWLNFDM